MYVTVAKLKFLVASPPVRHFSNVPGEVLVELTTVIKLEFLNVREKVPLDHWLIILILN